MEFLYMIRQGSEMVNKEYPRSKFLVAQGLLEGKTAEKENDVHKWRLIFRSEDGLNTIFLYCEDGKFGEPVFSPGPWLGVRAINISLIPRGLTHAFTRLQQEYGVKSFNSISLAWVLYPGVDQPSFRFGSGCKSYWIPIEKPDGPIMAMITG